MFRRVSRTIIALAFLWAPTAVGQLPVGFELVEVTRDPNQDDSVILNDCGQVVFVKEFGQRYEGREIMLHDNGATTRITTNDVPDVSADINNVGIIVWEQRPTPDTAYIWTYQDALEYVLFTGRTPDINDLGWIVFKRYGRPSCRGPEMDLFLFDGEQVQQVTDTNGDAHQSPEVNHHGEITWVRYDFCPEPWVSDILYMEAQKKLVLLTSLQPESVQIDEMGRIAWTGKDENYERLIEVYEDGETGDIALNRRDPDTGYFRPWLFKDGQFIQLTFDAFNGAARSINNWSEVALLKGTLPNTDVRLIRRIRTGDSEFDGDIDHDDLAKLVDCMTGPMWVERTDPGPEDSLCECRFLDINHDGSVDLRDYAIFQQNFGG
jgi:hypothetical protein